MSLFASHSVNRDSALIAMSGGVDSTVAAILMMGDGFDCAGAAMSLFKGGEGIALDAQAAADRLGIPFFTFDFSECFSECVISPFIKDYHEGRTPNPCIVCNKHLKFGMLMDKLQELGKDYLTTGHYARTELDVNGRYLLKRGVDSAKDQSYVLYTLTQKQLSFVRFPLGGLTKSQVREIALDKGFDNAAKHESQDICFIPDGDYAAFIREHSGASSRKGRFTDREGSDFGECKDIYYYTIGQRRGLGLAMTHPTYVLELRPEDSTVVIGKEEMLYSSSFSAVDINLIPFNRLDAPIRAQVKIRYSNPGHPAMIHQTADDTLFIEFDEPQRAITKGQAAVIYDGDTVLGGGTIA